MEFTKLKSFEGRAELEELEPDLVKEIQTILAIKVDGVVGTDTKKAFAEFKEDSYLQYPTTLGVSTIAVLLERVSGHVVSEQLDHLPTTVEVNAGTKTGRSMTLPNEEIVYANQFIIPDIPFTWGEFTKGCSPERTPLSMQIVANIHKTVKALGILRSKYNKPIGITSGYRPAALKIGARKSQHILGLAVDVCPLDYDDLHVVFQIMLTIPEFKAIGKGMAKGFVHGDCRDWDGNTIVFPY